MAAILSRGRAGYCTDTAISIPARHVRRCVRTFCRQYCLRKFWHLDQLSTARCDVAAVRLLPAKYPGADPWRAGRDHVAEYPAIPGCTVWHFSCGPRRSQRQPAVYRARTFTSACRLGCQSHCGSRKFRPCAAERAGRNRRPPHRDDLDRRTACQAERLDCEFRVAPRAKESTALPFAGCHQLQECIAARIRGQSAVR